MPQVANTFIYALCTLMIVGCSDSQNDDATEPEGRRSLAIEEVRANTSSDWYLAGETTISSAVELEEQASEDRRMAKNIILIVGDGMGIPTVTSGRIFQGQQAGLLGEEYSTSLDQMPYSGVVKTYTVDAQTPDSAGTMTALVTGVKTKTGVLAVSEDVSLNDCASMAGNELVTLLELAELADMATGIVTTARVTHATPAATYAKAAFRNWEDTSLMPPNAIEEGCKDIADQLVGFEASLEARFPGAEVDGIELVLGGGRRHFLPASELERGDDSAFQRVNGRRTDMRNLVQEWSEAYPGGLYIERGDALESESTLRSTHVLGLFNDSHMSYEADRRINAANEPSLLEMTKFALRKLQGSDKNGFFLVIESGRIDHAHHAGSAHGALTETLELFDAVQAVLDNTDNETLVVVTADHSHVMCMSGHSVRGNPILGKVALSLDGPPALAADGLPYTTLVYGNGRGFMSLGSETDADAALNLPRHEGRADLTQVDTLTPGFHQEALVSLEVETHGGEDVGIYASGPGSGLLRGAFEQNYVFHVIAHAGDLIRRAEAQFE